MTRVTRHMAIDRLRHEQRRAPRHLLTYDEAVADALPHMHGVGDSKDQAHLVRHLLGQLPKDQSKVILMAYFKGMTYDEIAEVLGVPHGTVKSRLRLGLQKLRALWHSANHESHSSPVFSRQLTDEER
jgi:RNA polymerase sigma-70 factor (ECF subfamily)